MSLPNSCDPCEELLGEIRSLKEKNAILEKRVEHMNRKMVDMTQARIRVQHINTTPCISGMNVDDIIHELKEVCSNNPGTECVINSIFSTDSEIQRRKPVPLIRTALLLSQAMRVATYRHINNFTWILTLAAIYYKVPIALWEVLSITGLILPYSTLMRKLDELEISAPRHSFALGLDGAVMTVQTASLGKPRQLPFIVRLHFWALPSDSNFTVEGGIRNIFSIPSISTDDFLKSLLFMSIEDYDRILEPITERAFKGIHTKAESYGCYVPVEELNHELRRECLVSCRADASVSADLRQEIIEATHVAFKQGQDFFIVFGDFEITSEVFRLDLRRVPIPVLPAIGLLHTEMRLCISLFRAWGPTVLVPCIKKMGWYVPEDGSDFNAADDAIHRITISIVMSLEKSKEYVDLKSVATTQCCNLRARYLAYFCYFYGIPYVEFRSAIRRGDAIKYEQFMKYFLHLFAYCNCRNYLPLWVKRLYLSNSLNGHVLDCLRRVETTIRTGNFYASDRFLEMCVKTAKRLTHHRATPEMFERKS
eukprot:Rmarinus@m.5230